MTLANCKECGKLYNKMVSEYCSDCNDIIEGYFSIISEYIYDNGPQPIHIVSAETGVKEKWIMQFIRDGRLIDSKIEYPCQQCGSYINRGKLCDKCIKKWDDSLDNKDKENMANIKGKMYSSEKSY